MQMLITIKSFKVMVCFLLKPLAVNKFVDESNKVEQSSHCYRSIEVVIHRFQETISQCGDLFSDTSMKI